MLFRSRSYDELTTALNEYLNGGSEEEEQKEEVAESTSNSTDAKAAGDAFDDLFNS